MMEADAEGAHSRGSSGQAILEGMFPIFFELMRAASYELKLHFEGWKLDGGLSLAYEWLDWHEERMASHGLEFQIKTRDAGFGDEWDMELLDPR